MFSGRWNLFQSFLCRLNNRFLSFVSHVLVLPATRSALEPKNCDRMPAMELGGDGSTPSWELDPVNQEIIELPAEIGKEQAWSTK